MGKEEGLLGGTWERKRDCLVGHGKGRGTARWDMGKEEGLLGGTWGRKRDCLVGKEDVLLSETSRGRGTAGGDCHIGRKRDCCVYKQQRLYHSTYMCYHMCVHVL